jgi:hypothetical protein
MSLFLYIHADGFAEASYQQGFDTAKLNNVATTAVTDVGDRAYVTQSPVKSAGSDTEVTWAMEIKDGNLRLNASIVVTRNRTAAWTDAERATLQNQFVAAVKASYTRLVAG